MAAADKLVYEIAAMYTGDAAIQAAFNDFAKLNAQGAKVVSQLDKLGKAGQDAGQKIRDQRTGYAQLGMQLNQFGGQLMNGTDLSIAFVQQIGDVGYALGQFEGKLGTVGRFLMGPWGAALSLAASLLGPLVANLFSGADAAKEMKSASERLADSERGLEQSTESLKDSTERYQLATAKTVKDQIELRKQFRLTSVEAMHSATMQVVAATSIVRGKIEQLGKVRASNTLLLENANASGEAGVAAGALMGANLRESNAVADLNVNLATLNTLRENLNKTIVSYQNRSVDLINAEKDTSASHDNTTRSVNAQKKSYDDLLKAKMSSFDKEGPGAVINNLLADSSQAIVQPMENLSNQITAVIQNAYGNQVLAAIRGPNQEMIKSFEQVGNAVDGAFKGMLTAGMSWKDGMKGIIDAVINELWKVYVTQKIVGFVTNAISGAFGGGSGIGSALAGTGAATSLSTIASGITGKAIGGAVQSGSPYLVGERGPELFVPARSGSIVPNGSMGGGMTINVDARGSADPAAVRAQVQQGILEAAPAIVAAAEQRTINTLRRPKLGGVMQ